MNNNDFKCESCIKEPISRINVGRFISRLDSCFKINDLNEAVNTVKYWEKEAEALKDYSGLLSVLNEELGLYRRINDKENALICIDKVKVLLNNTGNTVGLSRATVMINLATTLKAFGMPGEALKYYNTAEKIYISNNNTRSYEYASLLNNKSSTLIDLNLINDAEEALKNAIEILKAEGKHDADIGLSLISLAHLTYDRDQSTTEKVEALLDECWDYLTSERQKHDTDYAFAISKCVPSLRYFKREIEADALEETAKEIYGGRI